MKNTLGDVELSIKNPTIVCFTSANGTGETTPRRGHHPNGPASDVKNSSFVLDDCDYTDDQIEILTGRTQETVKKFFFAAAC